MQYSCSETHSSSPLPLDKCSLFTLIIGPCSAASAMLRQSCPTLPPHRRQPTRLPCPWDSPGKNTGVGCHFLLQCMKVKSQSEVAQSCPTLSDPMDCSPPGSSVHGIFQARALEWVASAFSGPCSSLLLFFKHSLCLLLFWFVFLIFFLLEYPSFATWWNTVFREFFGLWSKPHWHSENEYGLMWESEDLTFRAQLFHV